jgi:hypothetical protein
MMTSNIVQTSPYGEIRTDDVRYLLSQHPVSAKVDEEVAALTWGGED